jgi:CRISPR-associated protein Cmr2
MIYDYAAFIGQIEDQLTEVGTDLETATRYHKLVVVGRKKDSQRDAKDGADSLRDEWKDARKKTNYGSCTTEIQTLYEVIRRPDFSRAKREPLPPHTLAIEFQLTLASPYISRDEQIFYPIDNPVRKDRVLGLPVIAASTWKGNLRSAARTWLWEQGQDDGWSLNDVDSDAAMRRLFGNPRAAERDFHAGRVQCFATFFEQSALEIINPHDRARRVGKNPILIESVPTGAKGWFALLYVPFNVWEESERDPRIDVKEDWKLLGKAIKAMLLTEGFSAKRTSGFGLAEGTVSNGRLYVNADVPESLQPAPTAAVPPLPKYLGPDGYLKAEFLNSDGTLKTDAKYFGGKKPGKAAKLDYEKARKFYEKYGRGPDPSFASRPVPPSVAEVGVAFSSINQLVEHLQVLSQHLARQIKEGVQ